MATLPTRTLLALLAAVGIQSSRPAVQIEWMYNNTQWFPYDRMKVLHVTVEEQISIRCGPPVDMGIGAIFLVNEDGFRNCSAASKYRYDPTKGLTTKHSDPSSLFAEHMLYCTGSGLAKFINSIDFRFRSDAQGQTFYLIDVSNLTKYDGTDLSKEEEGGRCKYFGMKMKIDVLAPSVLPVKLTTKPTTKMATQPTTVRNIATSARNIINATNVASNSTEAPTTTVTATTTNMTSSDTARPTTVAKHTVVYTGPQGFSSAFKSSLGICQRLLLAVLVSISQRYI